MSHPPETVFNCLGSDFMSWQILILSGSIVFWYLIITFTTWIPAAKTAEDGARIALFWMAAIFIVCSMAGYGTTVLAGWFPTHAYILRVVLLYAQNIAAPWFLFSRRGKSFRLIGVQQKIGQELIEQWPKIDMDDRELAIFVRRLVAQNLELKAAAVSSK